MHEVRIDPGAFGMLAESTQQIGPHRDEELCASRRGVEPSEQLLPARFRRPVQREDVRGRRIHLIGVDGSAQVHGVSGVVGDHCIEKCAAAVVVQLVVRGNRFRCNARARDFSSLG